AMLHKSAMIGISVIGFCAFATGLQAQMGGQNGQPWRGAGVQPCFGAIDNAANKCGPAAETVAVKAGKLFDSKSGQMLTNQVVLLQGERIPEVGSAAQVRIPAGAQLIDLSNQTVMAGLIDLHTHMFNTPKQGMTREMSTLLAMNNTQADLRAGF